LRMGKNEPEIKNRDCLYQEFYEIFEDVLLRSIKPNMLLTITGGIDTRVIASILSVNGIKIPSVCFGSKLENIISMKIAAELNFEHYVSSRRGKALTDFLYNKGFRYLLTGVLFDESNGSFSGSKARTQEQFECYQKLGLDARFRDLEEIARGYRIRWVVPLLDGKVQSCLNKIPWQWRKGKAIQRWVLKNKFPRMWHIIYYDSLLPNLLPYSVHGIFGIMHQDFKPCVIRKVRSFCERRR
jgi:hypothetical protein